MSEILIKNMIKQIILEELSLKEEKKQIFSHEFIEQLSSLIKNESDIPLKEASLQKAIDFFKPPYTPLEKKLIVAIFLTVMSANNFTKLYPDFATAEEVKHGEATYEYIMKKKPASSKDFFEIADEFVKDFESIGPKPPSKDNLNRIAIALKELIKLGAESGEFSDEEAGNVDSDSEDNIFNFKGSNIYEKTKDFYKKIGDLFKNNQKIDKKQFYEIISNIQDYLDKFDSERLSLEELEDIEFTTEIRSGLDYAYQLLDKKQLSEEEKAKIDELYDLVTEEALEDHREYNQKLRDSYEAEKELQDIIDGVDGDGNEELEYDEDEDEYDEDVERYDEDEEDLEDEEEVDVFEDLDDNEDFEDFEFEDRDGNKASASEFAKAYLDFYNNGQDEEYKIKTGDFINLLEQDPGVIDDLAGLYGESIEFQPKESTGYGKFDNSGED